MLFRLLFLQVIAQLTSATPKEASLDTNHAQTAIIQDIELGAKNPAALFGESIEMTREGISNELIVDEIPSPQENFDRSPLNEDQPAVCSDPQTVRDCGTTITQSGTILRSPITSNSNLLYPASTDCKWNVEAPVGVNITVVTLCDFETASSAPSTSNCYEDYVEFQPSHGTDAIICGAYSSVSYKTSVNLLAIRFRSNSDSKVGAGFVFRIDFIEEGQPDVCYDPQTLRDCGTTITQSGTILRSPITSNNNWLYPASTDCQWNVEAPVGMNITVVPLCNFETASSAPSTSNCSEDYVEFQPSDGRDDIICGAYSSFSYKTSVNLLTIRFRSNGDSKVGTGFVFQIDFIEEGQRDVCYDPGTLRDCGTTITQSGTILRSPITSNNNWLYPASRDCQWNVEAPVGMNITVVPLCDFETASSTPSTGNCYEDYVEFQPSHGRDAIICGAYSSFSYETSVNLLTIRFRSNSDSKVGAGFVFRIDFIEEGQPDVCYEPRTLRDCGTTITQNGAILRSPITSNNNFLYPASTTCVWNVEAPPGSDIHVVSLCEFGTAPLSDTLSCRDDYLEFALSNGKTSRVCGGWKSFSVNTTGGANKLSIRFRSDSDDEVDKGFVVKISFNGGLGMFHCGALLMTLSVAAYALLSV